MITTEIDDSGYHLVDSETGARRSYTDRQEFMRAQLAEVLYHSIEVEEGLLRLEELYTRTTRVSP